MDEKLGDLGGRAMERHVRIYNVLDLFRSHATWLVTSLSPGSEKMSKHSSPAGDGKTLLGLLTRLRAKAADSGYQRQPHDFYVEPPWVVEALLDVEQFVGLVLDPACGSGTIPFVCRQRGITATGSDIANRGFGDVMDFFDRREPVANIASNPLFALVERFVEHALTLAADKVAILGRLALLEGQRRRVLLERTPLARVWVFSRR